MTIYFLNGEYFVAIKIAFMELCNINQNSVELTAQVANSDLSKVTL